MPAVLPLGGGRGQPGGAKVQGHLDNFQFPVPAVLPVGGNRGQPEGAGAQGQSMLQLTRLSSHPSVHLSTKVAGLREALRGLPFPFRHA